MEIFYLEKSNADYLDALWGQFISERSMTVLFYFDLQISYPYEIQE